MAVSTLTLSNIQQQIHTAYTNSTDTPSSTDDDWTIRLNHINRAIAYWGAQRNVEWNELWVVGNTTPSVITLSTTQYSLPADFDRMGNYVRLVMPDGSKQTVPVYQAEVARQFVNSPTYGVYISGTPKLYKLNLLWTPSATDPYIGATIEFDYYKYPLILSASTDVPEMSNPWYIVEYVTAKLFQTQSPTNYTIHNNNAIDLLGEMMKNNELTAYNNNSPQAISFSIGA